MFNRFALLRDTYGRPDIGRMGRTVIIGCLERGSWRLPLVCSGRPDIGVGAAAVTYFTPGIGGRTSASMAALIMDLATEELVSLADAGTAECSHTTRR